jgi:hypothetical protein
MSPAKPATDPDTRSAVVLPHDCRQCGRNDAAQADLLRAPSSPKC